MSNGANDRLPSLDGMRALGIITVLMCHAADGRASPILQAILPYFNGLAAVRVFFVISGFLITTLLLTEHDRKGNISLKRFYQRRIVRLFPVQFAYIMFLFILTVITPLQISECRFVTALTYLKNYGCAGKIDGHMWTLSVEEQFYLLWPLVLVFLPKKWYFTVAFLFIFISPFSRVYQYKFEYAPGTSPVWWWLTSNSDVIMIGCVAGLIFKKDWVRRLAFYRPGAGRILALALIVIPPIMTNYLLLGLFTVTVGPAIQAVGAAYLVISCIIVRDGILYKLLNTQVLVQIGLMSYSLYVWQQLFFFADPSDFGLKNLPILNFPIDLLVAVGAGCLSYFGLERPLAGLRRALAAGASAPDGRSRNTEGASLEQAG
jgi:peptidoglycan/LPS O-acetylase OafA/YrhL